MSENAFTRNFVQKNQSVLLRAVADATQAKVAEAMGGKDASYVSRFFKGEQKISCDEMCALLESCGLALHRMGEKDMVRLAKKYMESLTC
jgi:YesN/AraC family two-component response regulator